MAKRKKTVTAIENPRKIGTHVAKSLDYLEYVGASGVSVICKKHLRFSFKFRDEDFWFMLSSSPKDQDECANVARQLIRKAIRSKFPEFC